MSACSLLSARGCNTDNNNNPEHLRVLYHLLGYVLDAALHDVIFSLQWTFMVGTVVLILQSDWPSRGAQDSQV